jgi:elongation factor 1-alpha
MAEGQKHVSSVICGHVDAGKSTTTGRLIYELGGLPEREMEKLRAEAEALGKSSFAFAFYMDRQKEERERGVTIACTTKEFFTENFHYTIIDAPGHRDFIKNMITGASQADCARLINLLGVEQLMIGVNKMDDKSVNYAEARFTEIKKEVADMLVRVGYKKDKVAASVPFLPISGWEGDNLLKKSDKMAWWKGCDIKKIDGSDLHIDCLLDCLNDMVLVPPRPSDKDLRMPVSGVHKIKGVGDVITGRLEQGIVKPGDECVFIPTNTASTPCGGKIFSVEMHHKSVPEAGPGDNVGLNVKGLAKENMPRVGDVMVLKKDSKISRCKNFSAAVVVLEHPGQLKPGYTPVAFVRTGRSAVKMTSIKFKMGKSTGGQKVESPQFLETGDMAECAFEPVQAFVVEPFKTCAGLGRVAIMEGNSVVMLGKVMSAEYNL